VRRGELDTASTAVVALFGAPVDGPFAVEAAAGAMIFVDILHELIAIRKALSSPP
jgi:hypothetical protein